MRSAIQWSIETKDESEAREAQETLRTQDGLLGIRTLKPSDIRPYWRVLGYFDADGVPMNSWLPDTLRMVYLTSGLERELSAWRSSQSCSTD